MKIYQLMKDRKINDIIEYIKNKDIRGVSFLTIADLLVANHVPLEELKQRGAIVDYDQLFQEGEKYLSVIEQQPVNDHKCLKSLQEGLKLLVESWRSGTLQNTALEKRLTLGANDKLERSEKEGLLEIESQKYINKKVQDKLNGIYTAWLSKQVSAGETEELDKVVSDTLWGNWVADVNNFSHHAQTQMQENRVIVLLKNFKSGKLTEETRQVLENKVVDLILESESMEHNALRDRINKDAEGLKKGLLVKDMTEYYQAAIKNLLTNYPKGNLPGSVEKSLTVYITQALADTGLPAEEKAKVELEAAQMLLCQYKQSHCSQVLQAELNPMIKNIVIAYLDSKYTHDSVLLTALKKEIIEKMVDGWKRGELPAEVDKNLSVLFLHKNNALIRSINEMISPSVNANKIKQLENMVTKLMEVNTKLQERVETLEKSVRTRGNSNITSFGLFQSSDNNGAVQGNANTDTAQQYNTNNNTF